MRLCVAHVTGMLMCSQQDKSVISRSWSSVMNHNKRLEGLVAATFSPMTAHGEVNVSEVAAYVDYLRDKQGVNNIFVNGTTGEGMSLSVAERKLLAEEWCRRAKGKLEQVIVHVGCTSLKESQELARHSAQIGADGIAVISPSFFKPNTPDVLRSYLQQVASAAPTTPFYYYHMPGMTGVNFPVADMLDGMQEEIPSFRGVKFTGLDLMDLSLCVSRSADHCSLLYGVDEQLLAALVSGAHGAVGSTYNYAGAHANALLSAFEEGDLLRARSLQLKLQELVSFAVRQGFDVGVNKQLMAQVSGLHLGPPRAPVVTRPAAVASAIKEKYDSLFDM